MINVNPPRTHRMQLEKEIKTELRVMRSIRFDT